MEEAIIHRERTVADTYGVRGGNWNRGESNDCDERD
jgi:hypothetical protein